MNVADTIDTYGLDRLRSVSGIPRRTLYRWKKEGIPGKGTARDMRLQQLQAAVEQIEAADKPAAKAKPKKRKAA